VIFRLRSLKRNILNKRVFNLLSIFKVTFRHFSVIFKTIKKLLPYTLILIGVFGSLLAQNVTIKGKAHSSHINKRIDVYTYQDLVTKLKLKEATDTIGADGYFELKFHSGITQPVFVQIDNYIGKLYVRPDYVYGILFPEIDEQFKYYENAELPVNLSLIGGDTTELNMLILDYEALYTDVFTPKGNQFLTPRMLFKRADSLKTLCDERYSKIKDPYFINYYTYQIAGINASLSRGEKALINAFIANKKIQYHNYEYMSFFAQCFNNYLNAMASSKKGTTLYKIINQDASLQALNDFCKGDQFLKNDSLRELVIIRNLWDMYFNPEFNTEAIEAITSKINTTTKIEEHKLLTDYMLKNFFKMQPGLPAPMFFARGRFGGLESFEKAKGRWTYLNFFSTKNNETLKEMAKIADLRKKYKDKLNFVSVCLDDSLNSFMEYIKQNPKYDWPIWFNTVGGITQTAKELYNVIGTEAYFLINNSGTLALSPATAPSKGIEYKFNAIFKVKKKTTKTGIR